MNKILNIILAGVIFLSCSASKENETPGSTKKKLTLMTYNIHHGAPRDSEVINLNNIASVIRKSGAEVIALQEVDVNTERSGEVDQAKELAELLDMHYYFSKSIDYKGGDYGNMILSKYPLTNQRRLELPMPVPGEKRSIALATITLPDGNTFEFGSTHFDLQDSRKEQAAFLNELSKDLNKPLFIGGDFNATPDSEEMIVLKKEFNFSCIGPCPFSIPERNPNKAIDFVVYNKRVSEKFDFVNSAALKGEYASDHLPVVSVYMY